LHLTARQRLTWAAHLFKAVFYQYHRPFGPQVRPLIPSDGVILDVGAHAGQFTKLCAQLVPDGHVYAFEPSPYALSILTKVVSLKGLGNVTIVDKGLSSAPGQEVLHLPIKKRGSVGFGLAHLGDDQSGRALLSFEIALMTLDAFVAEQGLSRIDFIKADVEGWELHMLRGGADSLAKMRPSLLLEVHEMTLARADTKPSDVFGFFNALDYAVFATHEHDGYRCQPVDHWTGNGDFLFVPKEKAGLVAVA